jgi:proteasome maturation protein
MEPSHRLVPSSHGNAIKGASTTSTANSLGLHDTLRYGPKLMSEETRTIGSGLKERLESYEETQDNLKLTMQRNIYGLHAPMRLLMERKLVSQTFGIPALGLDKGNVHLDILMGRDELIEPHDVFGGMEVGPGIDGDIHTQMEKKLKL